MPAPVLGCYALKGGVGKTSAAVNLAWLAAEDGRKTLLWDLDPQAAATFLLNAKPKVKGGARRLLQGESDPAEAVKSTAYPGLDLLPAQVLYDSADVDLDASKRSEHRVARALRELGGYDLIIIDCPPGLSLLSANIVRACDVLLVPIIPSPLSLRTLDQVVDFRETIADAHASVLAFLSMVESRRALHRQVLDLIGDKYSQVAKTAIPMSATVERMGQRRAPLVAWASGTRVAGCYRELWNEVARALDG